MARKLAQRAEDVHFGSSVVGCLFQTICTSIRQAAPCVLAYLCCAPASAILCKGKAAEKNATVHCHASQHISSVSPIHPSRRRQFGGFNEQ